MNRLIHRRQSRKIVAVSGVFVAGIGALLLLLWPWAAEPRVHGQTPEAKEELVYIDQNGIVQVFDPPQSNGAYDTPRLIWHSPTEHGRWADVSVGDFTADGDDEIVAVRPESNDGINLAIYDPVIAASQALTPGQVITGDAFNLVPWRVLTATQVTGRPYLVAAGDFDPTTPGDEILYTYRLDIPAADAPAAPDLRMQLLRRAPGDTDGAHWTPLGLPVPTDIDWKRASVGQLIAGGPEEFALIGTEGSNKGSVLGIFRVDGDTITTLYENGSEDKPWTDATIGQFLPGGDGNGEVAVVREAFDQLERFFVFIYSPNDPTNFVDFDDGVKDVYVPSPRRVIAADINANGDDEAFLLRDSLPNPPPPTPTPAPRANIFMRDPSKDAIRPFEVAIPDGGYKEGAGLQIDDDPNDELLLARSDRFMIFYQPEVNTNVLIFSASVNSALHVGNLDSAGIIRFPELQVDPVEPIEALVRPGQQSPERYVLQLTSNPLYATAFAVVVKDNPAWITVEPTSGTLPASLVVTFPTTGLKPLDTLQTTIEVTVADDRFIQRTLRIPVKLTVLPGLYPQPELVRVFAPCPATGPLTDTAPATAKIAIGGLVGVPFSVTPINQPQPDWLAYTVDSSLLPANLSLTISPDKRAIGATAEQTELEIRAQSNQGDDLSVTVPVAIDCEAARLWLPLLTQP